MATTKRKFSFVKGEFFQIVDQWAQENGFKIKEKGDTYRLYQKGSYWSWNAHPKVYLESKDSKVVVDSWINPIFGGRIPIDSEGILGFAAKAAARDPINKLLSKLGQPPIL